MNIGQALENKGAKGISVGPVKVTKVYPQEEKDNPFKAGTKQKSQGIEAEDSTGKVRAYFTDRPDARDLEGKIIEMAGINISKGGHIGAYGAAVVRVVEAGQASDNSDKLIDVPPQDIQAVADEVGHIFEACVKAFTKAHGTPLPDLSGIDDKESFEIAARTWQTHSASINTMMIEVCKRLSNGRR